MADTSSGASNTVVYSSDGSNSDPGMGGSTTNTQFPGFSLPSLPPLFGNGGSSGSGSSGSGSNSGSNQAFTGQIGDYIKQFTVGIVDSFINASEHLLIYTVFAVLFIMLIYVMISDQSPGDIIVNTGKAVGKVAELTAE